MMEYDQESRAHSASLSTRLICPSLVISSMVILPAVVRHLVASVVVL